MNSLAVLSLEGASGTRKKSSFYTRSGWEEVQTTFGIEPEEMNYMTMKITTTDMRCLPRHIESAYCLRHFTNDPRWREMGKTFLVSLTKYCRTDIGYAALSDVEKKTKQDEMESFFFAETLKYLYLLYAPPETVDLSKVVFNTQVHPIRRTW